MIVTLYKECKLNNKYNDCFFNKTYLETYLGSLVKKSFTIDDTFSRNQDRLVFENEEYFITKDYNYIKIEDSVIGTFYAFIRNIEWVNGLFLLYYEEDIWHNWFDKIKIRNGLLTRSLTKKYNYVNETKNIKYFSYPIASESNDEPVLTKLTSNSIGIVVKMQLYTLSQQGQENNRQERVFCVGIKEQDYVTPGNYEIRTDFYSDINEIITRLIILQQTTQIGNSYYQIDDIYAVPLEFTTFERFLPYTGTQHLEIVDGNTTICCMDILGTTLHTPNTPVKTFEYNINYDRRNFAVGNYSNPIKFNNNGTDVNVKIEIWGVNTYKIIMLLNNNIIDITDDYYVDLPFNTITASSLQIKRMQYDNDMATYNTKIKNLNNEIANAYFQEVGATISSIGSMVTNPLSIGNAIGSQISILGRQEANIYNAKNEITLYEEKTKLLNRKIYDNTYIVKNKINYINASKGLSIWYVNEDNTEQVEGIKNLFGYQVNQPIFDNIFTPNELAMIETNKYNIYRFEYVGVYGAIAQDYITLFESILTKGVRIWADSSISI